MAVEPVLAPLLAWLATAAIHGTVLALAAWALGATLGRLVEDRVALAAARERLWKLALFGGIVTASLAVAGGRAWRIDLPLPAPEHPILAPAHPAPDAPARTSEAGPAVASTPAARPSLSLSWIELAALIWLAGVAVGTGLWVHDQRRLGSRLRGRTRVAAGPAFERLRELAQLSGAKGEVALSFAPGLTAPITRGVLRPEICLPPRAERELLPEELGAMLAHELAHARRRDPLLLALCRAVEVALLLQPLSRFARRHLLEEIEILCDDHAARWTGDPASLASCLAEVATWIVTGSPEAGAIAMAGRRSRLEQRVHQLIYRRRPAASRGRRWIVAAAIFALSATTLPLPAIAMGSDESGSDESTDAPEPAGLDGDSGAKAPEPEPATEVRSMREALAALDAEYAALNSHPGLAQASQELRDRLQGIGAHLATVRAMETELERLVAEELSAERPEQP